MTRQVKGRTQPLLIRSTSHPRRPEPLNHPTSRCDELQSVPLIHLHVMLTVRRRVTLNPAPPGMIALGRIRVRCSSPTPPTVLALVYQSDAVDASGPVLKKPRAPPPMLANVARGRGTCRRARHESSTVELRGINKGEGFCVDIKVWGMLAFLLRCCSVSVAMVKAAVRCAAQR